MSTRAEIARVEDGTQLKDEGTRTQVLIAGATAGLVARFIIAPLDVVKIRLQLQTRFTPSNLTSPTPARPLYTTTLSTLTHIYRNEGLFALWRGNIPASYLYISYSALQFTIYRSTSQVLTSPTAKEAYHLPPSAVSFISGAVAGASATTLTYPLDLLRTRFAAQGNQKVYPSLYRSILIIAHDEGVKGFFRGSSAAVSQIVPYMGSFFLLYESLRPVLSPLPLPFSSGDAVAGILASVIAKTAVFPLDLVRKKLQVQGPTRSMYIHGDMLPEYRGVVRTIGRILREEGPRGLYRGLMVSLWKAAPASAVTMWTYERALRGLQEMDKLRQEKKRGKIQEP